SEHVTDQLSIQRGSLSIVGIGPGAHAHTTPRALEAIARADVVVGYVTYIRLVADLVQGKEIVRTGMTEEIERARVAVERARAGAQVAIISSGDAGVYGMAGLVFQVLKESGWRRGDAPELQLIPGITALNACASLVGAPLGHDFCAISLSDLLTPWAVIERRIRAAAESDFVIGLYNPASGRRTRQIVRAHEIISEHRAPDTPVALVKSAYRRREERVLTDLAHCLDYEIGMLTTVIVGSTQTFEFEGYMVTPRGYANKYTWDGAPRPGQTPGRSLIVASSPGEEP
ncbi:MAG TPA: precorrin-3B C(17)-methyltransferase, partial [Polyangiaceae bacterium]|nr:precorrin-3B C(17)-methyltransferase [Polyangiaceae bacterium]